MADKQHLTSGFPRIDLGHEQASAFLESCVRGRVPALLFTGPKGSGGEYTAIDFARMLCCERETKREIEENKRVMGSEQAFTRQLEGQDIHRQLDEGAPFSASPRVFGS